MRGKVVAAVVVPALLLAGAGGYAWADAADLVPGVLTSSPEPTPQPPLITASPVAAASPTPGPVSDFDINAPIPSSTQVDALAAALRADDRTGDSTNVAVVDYLTGRVITSLDGDETQVPASTTKLLTVTAALHALGPDYTAATTLRWDEARRRLTLVAGGDMLLAAGLGHHGETLDATGRPDAQGWAGIGDLVEQAVGSVDDAGQITVDVDTSAYPGPIWPAEWPQYARDLGYAAPVTGVAVNVGKKSDGEYALRYDDPALAAVDVVVAALDERGYTAKRGTRAAAGSNAIEVASVQSAPLSAVATYLLTVSDNTVSEQLARNLAIAVGQPATPSGEAAAIVAQLADLGVDTAGLALYDGAGFSTRNRIAPLQLTSTLVLARSAENTRDLLDYLPLAGLEGTVGDRYSPSDAAAGFVRAKTGSLTGVTALTGVVTTADGRLLAFATLLDGMPQGQPRPKAAVDEFVTALADCGCGG